MVTQTLIKLKNETKYKQKKKLFLVTNNHNSKLTAIFSPAEHENVDLNDENEHFKQARMVLNYDTLL